MTPLPTSSSSRLTAWAQLVRLPNVFTVIADVGAAYLLVAGAGRPVLPLILILLSGIALYWAGMVLNDVFDVEQDRRERPGRPIPAGRVSPGSATQAGWSLLIAGIALAAGCGTLPLVVAVALAAMIIAYDGPLKATPLAPAAMGACRFLSFLLGATAALSAGGSISVPSYVWMTAAGFGVYITGVTTMARDEARGGRRRLLIAGLLITIGGLVVLASVPAWLGPADHWRRAAVRVFPGLIAVIGLPVVGRALSAVAQPTAAHVQRTIRVGVLSLIPLAACFAFLGAGAVWGALIISLLAASLVLASRFRVT